MPPSHEEQRVSLLLREFLESDARARAGGYTLPNLTLRVEHAISGIEEVRQEVGALAARVNRHGRDIAAIKAHIELDTGESTGSHNIPPGFLEMQRALAEQRTALLAAEQRRFDSGLWWKRAWVKWAMGIGAVLITASVVGCATYVIPRIARGAPAPQQQLKGK
jgi:hypothetical protein